MNSSKSVLVFAVLLLLLLHFFSGTTAFAQTQGAMNVEACDEYATADRAMNVAYRRVLSQRGADRLFVRKLRAAQRAWLAYRDAHVASLFPATDPRREYGSAFPMCRCLVLKEATEKRTEELRRWVDGVPEGDICAASMGMRSNPDVSSGIGGNGAANPDFGKRWTLIRMGERSFGANAPYLEFDVSQGRFSGFTGCNRIFGDFLVNEESVTFTSIVSTKRACAAADARAIEASFTRALESVTRSSVQADTLRLYAADSLVLVFK